MKAWGVLETDCEWREGVATMADLISDEDS